MAETPNNLNELIFIKRVKKGHHDESHGGAWKIAYADFVTAMMAFFLLMWLLSSTTEEQRTAISNYFAPASVSRSTSGSGDILGGRTLDEEDGMAGNRVRPGIVVGIPPQEQGDEEEEAQQAADEAAAREAAEQAEAAEAAENERFAAAEQALRESIEGDSLLSEYEENIRAEVTLEGFKIELVDSEGRPMFPLGSAELMDHTREILGRIAEIVRHLPNKITISGHTDAAPFNAGTGYGNWELSTDRAHAGRRALTAAGLSEARIAHVAGKASSELLDPEMPEAPHNRRISILLMRGETVRDRPPPRALPEAPEAPGGIEAGGADDGSDSAQGESAPAATPGDAPAPVRDPLAGELWQRVN